MKGREKPINIAKYIDHTLLRANATEAEIIKICKEAREYGFASVCVNEYYTGLVKRELEGSDVKVCAVVGFPLGANKLGGKKIRNHGCPGKWCR